MNNTLNLTWEEMNNSIGNIINIDSGLRQATTYGIYTSGAPLLIDLDDVMYRKGTHHELAFDFIEGKIKVIEFHYNPDATFSHCEVPITFPLDKYIDLN